MSDFSSPMNLSTVNLLSDLFYVNTEICSFSRVPLCIFTLLQVRINVVQRDPDLSPLIHARFLQTEDTRSFKLPLIPLV